MAILLTWIFNQPGKTAQMIQKWVIILLFQDIPRFFIDKTITGENAARCFSFVPNKKVTRIVNKISNNISGNITMRKGPYHNYVST